MQDFAKTFWCEARLKFKSFGFEGGLMFKIFGIIATSALLLKICWCQSNLDSNLEFVEHFGFEATLLLMHLGFTENFP